jgi:hypothetical protein
MRLLYFISVNNSGKRIKRERRNICVEAIGTEVCGWVFGIYFFFLFAGELRNIRRVHMKYCFGVDIGGTTVKMGLFTTEGELLDKWEIKTHTENKGESILPEIAQAIMDKMREKDIAKDNI